MIQKHEPPIILASGSQSRASMLRSAGLSFEVISPKVDEESVKAALTADHQSPRNIADALAEMKCVKVAQRRPEAFVIAADQVLELEGQIMSKPAGAADAARQLSLLRGKNHDLHSAVVISHAGEIAFRFVKSARLHMRDFSDEFLADYLQQAGESVLWTVGCYQIESIGVHLFDRVDGDHFTILGLPLIETLNYLRIRGLLIT